jgi:hypothetical protein
MKPLITKAAALAGGDIVLDWGTRSTTRVEAIIGQATARGVITVSALATATGCVTLLLAVGNILS